MSTNPNPDEPEMTDFRQVTDDFAVSPQIDLADLPAAAAQPKLLGTFTDWDAFATGSGNAKQCWVITVPTRTTPLCPPTASGWVAS